MTEILIDFSTCSCVLFGGGNGWGKRIAETFVSLNCKTCIIEKDTTHDEIISAIQSSEIVFIAIPDSDIQSLLENYGDKFHDKIVLDCATNKSDFSDALIKLANTGVSVCSTHPI